jgi:hypothetical protein
MLSQGRCAVAMSLLILAHSVLRLKPTKTTTRADEQQEGAGKMLQAPLQLPQPQTSGSQQVSCVCHRRTSNLTCRGGYSLGSQ